MIRTQIYLPEHLKLQLQVFAQNENIPVSEVIRRSVYKEIGRKRKMTNAGSTLLKIAKMAKRGCPKDLSTNMFNYLYGNKSNYAKKQKKLS